MSKKTNVYRVNISAAKEKVLMVRAGSVNAAIRHVAGGLIEAETISADEALSLSSEGVKIETAGEDADTAALPGV